MEFQFRTVSVDGWHIHFLEFQRGNIVALTVVYGMLANAFPTSQTGKDRLLGWKQKIAKEIYAKRGSKPADPRRLYVASLGMRFFPPTHQNQLLDIENFIKPILDGIAAGLFCGEDVDPSGLTRFNFDDSNFRYLLIERLPDAGNKNQEGVAIVVSQL